DPRLGLYAWLDELIARHGINKGRIQLTLARGEHQAGLTINEYETLLMQHDLIDVLRNPFRFVAEKGRNLLADPWNIPNKTFDDGPNPAVTPLLLDTLERHRVRATFFLIGRWVRACNSIAADIAAHGHTIGNHTDSHPNTIWLPTRHIVEELRRCQDAVAKA